MFSRHGLTLLCSLAGFGASSYDISKYENLECLQLAFRVD